MKKIILTLAMAFAMILLAGNVYSISSISFIIQGNNTEDVSVLQDFPNNNTATIDDGFSYNTTSTWRCHDPPKRTRSYYRFFNLTNITSGATIQEAYLNLYLLEGATFGLTLDVEDVVNMTWDEKTITWNNQPCSNVSGQVDPCGGTNNFVVNVDNTLGEFKKWNVTNTTKFWYARGGSNISLMLWAPDEGSCTDKYRTFRSRCSSSAFALQYPYLNITYNPNTNNSASVTINAPSTNSQTHNATPFINISITAGTFNNMSFAVFLDTNSNPVNMINSSNLTTAVNFTISTYTITQQIAGSINGTYYLKVNGTDNQSNAFSTTINFNLTNDINQYNATNVSLIPLPLSAATQAKCHFNITNKISVSSMPNQNDNISISDLKWYINGSELVTAGNNSLLNAPNVTDQAKINCSVRINNGFGDTSWTLYSSSQVTAGDTTAPTINSFSISSTSPLTTDIVNITANVTDNSSINFVRVTVDSTNFSMTGIGNNIFQYAVTWSLGQHNISYFIAQDTSANTQTNTSTINFTVTSPPSGGGGSGSGSGGGGGGGGATTIENVILGNLSIQTKPPILSRIYIFAPFRHDSELFKFTFTTNKQLDRCTSSTWNCSVAINSFTISYNYSSSSLFSKISGDVILLDSAGLAKSITPSVTFINIGYAFPYKTDATSTNYAVFLLNDSKAIIGIRLWFVLGLGILAIAVIILVKRYA